MNSPFLRAIHLLLGRAKLVFADAMHADGPVGQSRSLEAWASLRHAVDHLQKTEAAR